MSQPTDGEYFSVADAARYLHVSRTTVWRWIEQGKLRAWRVGEKTIRIKTDDLEGLLKPFQRPREPAAILEPQNVEKVGIWADYRPEKVREALKKGAGALLGVDRDRLIRDLHDERQQESKGRPA